jgi:UDP-GlcNAc:undecaprenyl-phosphate/decaprenyl-phosphate GlcNAc-1-phosphate transferase
MLLTANQAVLIVLATLSALLITGFSIPVIIRIARRNGIMDDPSDERKIHDHFIPTLGGIAIFIGVVIAFSAWIGHQPPIYYSYLMAALVIIIVVGLKDDIEAVSPYLKLIAQFVAAGIVVVGAGIKLHHFDGFLGIDDPLTSTPSSSPPYLWW